MSVAGKIERLRRLIHEGTAGRPVITPPWLELEGTQDLKLRDTNESLVIVVHEASQTGAPKIALDLGRGLSKSFNIIFVLLSSGSRLQDFVENSARVFLVEEPQNYLDLAAHLSGRYRILVSILNSIETGGMAAPLLENGIATVTYVHEFAETTSAEMAATALSYSVSSVFSTQEALQSFRRTLPGLSTAGISIIPQGILGFGFPEPDQSTDNRLPWQTLNRLLVMGAGHVSFRKGVDLFIEVARKIKASSVGERCVFVWCGEGASDGSLYSRFLEFQVRNAGLELDIHFIEGMPVEPWFRDAEVFLLTSRLDPLPLVALEAASAGTVVLSFGETGGLGEVFDLTESVVAPPFDTDALASKAVTLLKDEKLRARYSTEFEHAVRDKLSFNQYLIKIYAVLNQAKNRLSHLQADFQPAVGDVVEPSEGSPDGRTFPELVRHHNLGHGAIFTGPMNP